MSHPVRESSDEPRLDGVRVLVVDDAALVLDAVTEVLRHVGATVTAVASAEAALRALQSELPDVLLSDISMPGKDGYWLIDRVRALPAEGAGSTPAIAFTADSGASDCAQVLRAGFQVCLAKPASIRELVRVVAALHGSRARSHNGRPTAHA
jgi:CheY-like chemotaxis protein